MSVENTINAIRSQEGIVYVPHPYDEKRAKTVLNEEEIARHRQQIDCIECHNGRNVSSYYDIRQADIAKKYDLPMVIGSDAHTFFEIGRNYMNIDIEPYDAKHFKAAIENAGFHQMKCIKICHRFTVIARVIQLLKRGKIHELYRIIYRKIKR